MEKQATPFLKWVGGKRGIIQELKNRLPVDFNDYYEPFVGGGALFFELAPVLTGGVFLSDVNSALITTYQMIKQRPTELIELLKAYKARHCKDFYYAIRSEHNLIDPIEIAAKMVYQQNLLQRIIPCEQERRI